MVYTILNSQQGVGVSQGECIQLAKISTEMECSIQFRDQHTGTAPAAVTWFNDIML